MKNSKKNKKSENKIITFLKKNYVFIIPIAIIIILFLAMTIIWIKKGTFGLDEENIFIINCPMTSVASREVECDLYLNTSEKNILSVNANYDFDEGVSYVSYGVDASCTGDKCLEPLAITENGFAIYNTEGVTGNVFLGRLVIKFDDDVTPNKEYKIGLKNIELSNSDYEMIELDESYTTVRILNNVATLDDLTVNHGEFDKLFDSNVFKYTLAVSSEIDQIRFGVVKSDPNSVIFGTGAMGLLNLNYGTNTFDINVRSEDETKTNTYLIDVYREYDFKLNSTYYVYDKENNYIYTAADDSVTILNNLDSLGDDLYYSVTKDKLKILHGDDEVVKSIDIIGFESDYLVSKADKVIYVGYDLSYLTLTNKIKSNVLTLKVVDENNNEVTNLGTVINDGYKLNVYYNDKLLDTYNFAMETFSIDNKLIIDEENNIAKRIPLETKYADFKKLFNTTGKITIVSNNGSNLTDTDVVKTGDQIIIRLANATLTYTLSVLGDVSGDGVLDIDDVDILYRYFRGRTEVSKEEQAAGDIVNDGITDIDDVDILYRFYRGRINSLEVVE